MTAWNLLPWQLRGPCKAADTAITTHSSSSCYHLNINYSPTKEIVQLNFLPPKKQAGTNGTEKNKLKKKTIVNKCSVKTRSIDKKDMFKQILILNDSSNKSIQVPQNSCKSNTKDKKCKKKKGSPSTAIKQVVVTDSINTNTVCDSNDVITEKKVHIKSGETNKKTKHRHSRRRSQATLVTITDTVSVEHSRECQKTSANKTKKHRHHSERSQTATVSEIVSTEVCKDQIKVSKDAYTKYKQQECSEETLTITGTFSISNSNDRIKTSEPTKDDTLVSKKHVYEKSNKKSKKKKEKTVIDSQQQLQNILANFETVSGKQTQIYYVNSTTAVRPETSVVLRTDSKESLKNKHVHKNKRRRKHHLSLETKCKGIKTTMSSSSESNEGIAPVETRKEGIKYFFVRNKITTKEDPGKKMFISKEHKKSRKKEHRDHKYGTAETKLTDNNPVDDISKKQKKKKAVDVLQMSSKSVNRSKSVDAKTLKKHVDRDSVETLHYVGDVGGKVNKTYKTRCASQDKTARAFQKHSYNKRQSKSETNLKHKESERTSMKRDLVDSNKIKIDRKESSKGETVTVENKSSDTEAPKKPEGSSVIEKLFFKRNRNKSKQTEIKQKKTDVKHVFENKAQTHDSKGNVTSTNSSHEREKQAFDENKEKSKKRKRSKHVSEKPHSVDRKPSEHKVIESTGIGDSEVHKRHKTAKRVHKHHHKCIATEETTPKSSEDVPKGNMEESKPTNKKSKRRKETDEVKHLKGQSQKFVGNTSKSTLPTEQEQAASITDNSEVINQFSTEERYCSKIDRLIDGDKKLENKIMKSDNKKIIKISKEQLETIINQINKKHNLQQSKTLQYKLPSSEHKGVSKGIRKEVSFSHLNLQPVIACYASTLAAQTCFSGKQLDSINTYNSILTFALKDKKQSKPKRKTKTPDHKSVVSEAITKKEKCQYICGRRYATNRAARNFAYSENVFERSRKALRENGPSTVGFTVEGVEPPRRLKPNIVPSCLLKPRRELCIAIVSAIDIQPKYEGDHWRAGQHMVTPQDQTSRALSFFNAAVDEDFTDTKALSDASEKQNSSQGMPHAHTFPSLLSIPSQDESHKSNIFPSNMRNAPEQDFNQRSIPTKSPGRTKSYRSKSTEQQLNQQLLHEEEPLDKEQFAALGQEVFKRMMQYLKEYKITKEEHPNIKTKSVTPFCHVARSRARKSVQDVNEKRRDSSTSSKRSVALSASKKSTNAVLNKGTPEEINKRHASLSSTGSTSPKKHLNTPIRDRSLSVPRNDPIPRRDVLVENKSRASRENSVETNRSPTKANDPLLNYTRKRSQARNAVSAEREVPLNNTLRSLETSKESLPKHTHVSLYDRPRMQQQKSSSLSRKEASAERKNSVSSPRETKGTKIPIRVVKLPKSSPERKSLDRKLGEEKSTKQRQKSASSTSSALSSAQKRTPSLESKRMFKTAEHLKTPERTRSLRMSETFLCDSFGDDYKKELKTAVAHCLNVKGETALGKITEETKSQNSVDIKYPQLIENVRNKGKKTNLTQQQQLGECNIGKQNVEVDGYLKHLSSEMFQNILLMLNGENPFKLATEGGKVPRSSTYCDDDAQPHLPEKETSQTHVFNSSESHSDREDLQASAKDSLRDGDKVFVVNFTDSTIPKTTLNDGQDRSPEIQCEICITEAEPARTSFENNLLVDSTREIPSRTVDNSLENNFAVKSKTSSGTPVGKSKIPLRKEVDSAKSINTHAVSNTIGATDGAPIQVCNDNESQAVEEDEVGGTELQMLSNLVKQNVMKELGAAHLLKPNILEAKARKGHQLDNIIERSIATALNQRVYSMIQSIQINEDVFKTTGAQQFIRAESWHQDCNSFQEPVGYAFDTVASKNTQEVTEVEKNESYKSNNTRINKMVENRQQKESDTVENKKEAIFQKLSTMLASEPDYLYLESRLDKLLETQQEDKTDSLGRQSQVQNSKKPKQIGYTVPAKRCKIRKSRLKINSSHETNVGRKTPDVSPSKICNSQQLKSPHTDPICTTAPSKNCREVKPITSTCSQNKSKIPTLIKPATSKWVPKLATSDTSEIYSSKTKGINSTDKSFNSVEDNTAAQSADNFEQPNSARFLTKLLDIEIIENSANQDNVSSSKLINIPSKAKTSSCINRKHERPLSAYEKRKLYGEKLRLKKINSKNEPALTSSTEQDKCVHEDCIFCRSEANRAVSLDFELQKYPQKETSPSRPPNNTRTQTGGNQESNENLPTLGCYLCTKLHCNPKSNMREPDEDGPKKFFPAKMKYRTGACPKRDSQNKFAPDENIYQAYSVVADYPNVTAVFRNKFKTGSSISLFSRESMFSCDNISPCVSPRLCASNGSLSTFNSRTLYSRKSSSLLDCKHSDDLYNAYQETKRQASRRMPKSSRFYKKYYMGNVDRNVGYCSHSKEMFGTIEQNHGSFTQPKKHVGNALNITPSYEYCHSTPEYVQRKVDEIPFAEQKLPLHCRSSGIRRRKRNLLEACQRLRTSPLSDYHSNESGKEDDPSKYNLKSRRLQELRKSNYEKVNKKTFFKDTKSLIYQNLENTSRKKNRENVVPPHLSDSQCNLADSFAKPNSDSSVFEEYQLTSRSRRENTNCLEARTPVRTTKHKRKEERKHHKNKLKSKRLRYGEMLKIVENGGKHEATGYAKEFTDVPYKLAKEEDESYTIFKLDNDFQIHRRRKMDSDKNESEECFKIFAYNNVVELDVDCPVLCSTYSNNAHMDKTFLFSNPEKSCRYKKGRLRKRRKEDIPCPSLDVNSAEKSESGYGSARTYKSGSLRKFFPRDDTILDTFTSSFRCFDHEVCIGRSNPLSKVTTFPVNTGTCSKIYGGRQNDSSERQRDNRRRQQLARDDSPTSDCSEFSNHDRQNKPISFLYNVGLEHSDHCSAKEERSGKSDGLRKKVYMEYDQKDRVEFEFGVRKFHNEQRYREYRSDNNDTFRESEKRRRSRIPQKLKPRAAVHCNDLEDTEEQLPYVCERHKPLLYLKQNLRNNCDRKEHQSIRFNVDEEQTFDSDYQKVSPRMLYQKLPTNPRDRISKHVSYQKKPSSAYEIESDDSIEEERRLHKRELTPPIDKKHRTGGRFKELIRSISRPFHVSKKPYEEDLAVDDQISSYSTSTRNSEPNQKYFSFENKENRNLASEVASKTPETSLKDAETPEAHCKKIQDYKRLQKQVDQCHEYANKVCTESRMRKQGYFKQFVDFKEIPLSVLLGRKASQPTESTTSSNSSKKNNRSINSPPKLKVLDDTQRSRKVLELKSVHEDAEDRTSSYNQPSNVKNNYFKGEAVNNLKNVRTLKNKPLNKSSGCAKEPTLRSLLENIECKKELCEGIRNRLKKSNCSKEAYNDLAKVLNQADCAEETCKHLRNLLKELKETFLEGTEGTSVNLKKVPKESIMPLKELLDIEFRKLLNTPVQSELMNENSTELMRFPSATSCRTYSQESLKELLDSPYHESTQTTKILSEDSAVPLRDLLDIVFDELLSINSNDDTKLSTHFIKTPGELSHASVKKSSELSSSECTVSSILTDPFIELAKSPAKTSLKKTHMQSSNNAATNRKRFAIESLRVSSKEVQTQPAVSQIDKLLGDFAQKRNGKLLESLKQHLEKPLQEVQVNAFKSLPQSSAKESITELYPPYTQSTMSHLKGLSRESKELLQLTLQKVLSHSKENLLPESSKHHSVKKSSRSKARRPTLNEAPLPKSTPTKHSKKEGAEPSNNKGFQSASQDSNETLEDFIQKLSTLSETSPVNSSLRKIIALPAEVSLTNSGRYFVTGISELSLSEYSGPSSNRKRFFKEFGKILSKDTLICVGDKQTKSDMSLAASDESLCAEAREEKPTNDVESKNVPSLTEILLKELLQHYAETSSNSSRKVSAQRDEDALNTSAKCLYSNAPNGEAEEISKSKSGSGGTKHLKSILEKSLNPAIQEAIQKILKPLPENENKGLEVDLHPNGEHLVKETDLSEQPEEHDQFVEEPLDLSMKETFIERFEPLDLVRLQAKAPSQSIRRRPLQPPVWGYTKITCNRFREYSDQPKQDSSEIQNAQSETSIEEVFEETLPCGSDMLNKGFREPSPTDPLKCTKTTCQTFKKSEISKERLEEVFQQLISLSKEAVSSNDMLESVVNICNEIGVSDQGLPNDILKQNKAVGVIDMKMQPINTPLSCTKSTCTGQTGIQTSAEWYENSSSKETSVQVVTSLPHEFTWKPLSESTPESLKVDINTVSTQANELLDDVFQKLSESPLVCPPKDEKVAFPKGECTNTTCPYPRKATKTGKLPCKCPAKKRQKEMSPSIKDPNKNQKNLEETASLPKKGAATCKKDTCSFQETKSVRSEPNQKATVECQYEEPAKPIEPTVSNKVSYKPSNTTINISKSVQSNDLTQLVEATLRQPAPEPLQSGGEEQSSVCAECSQTELLPNLNDTQSQFEKLKEADQKSICSCDNLISFEEEPFDISALMEFAVTVPQQSAVENVLGHCKDKEPFLHKPDCNNLKFATASQDSQELANTIFQNLIKSSGQINEPQSGVSISQPSVPTEKTLISKHVPDFPEASELLLAMQTILDTSKQTTGMFLKGPSKGLDSSHRSCKAKCRESSDPNDASEISEELLKQLCNVSLKAMMELHGKVSDKKEASMSFKAMVEELCKNKVLEDNLNTQSQLNVINVLKNYSGKDNQADCVCRKTKDKKGISEMSVIDEEEYEIFSTIEKEQEEDDEVEPEKIVDLKSDGGTSIKSEKSFPNLAFGAMEDATGSRSPLKELRDSLTDKELFEKLLDSYEKEENIVERLSNDDEFFKSQLELVRSKESVESILQEVSPKSEETIISTLNLDSFSDLEKEAEIASVSPTMSIRKSTESIAAPQHRPSKSKISGFTSRVAKLFKSDTVKEIVAPRVDTHKYSVDVSYLGKHSESHMEIDEEAQQIHKSISNDDIDDSQKVTFIGRDPFYEEKKLLGKKKEESKKTKKRKLSTDSDSNVVKPTELGKCFLRGFRSDYVSLGGDTCLLISNQEKQREINQRLKNEAYIEFSERDTPLEYLLALGFSIDEASNAIKDEDVKNRLFAAITEARVWINQISTVQGTLLYLIAYKAKPRIMRYYLQLVEAIINRRIQNAVKLDAFLRVLEKVEDGDLTMINIVGSDKFDDEENEEKIVKKQLRQLFINVYNTAETEANLKKKPLTKEGIILLRILAAKYRAGLHPHLELIARYIGQGLLRNEVQLEAAMIYLSRLDTADVNLKEFEQYCGIACKENNTPASDSKQAD